MRSKYVPYIVIFTLAAAGFISIMRHESDAMLMEIRGMNARPSIDFTAREQEDA